nr:SHOCT domain-containing protein [uncultured Campylobacter sp.]
MRAQDLEERLRRLYELYESGTISKEEFEARKEILLG